jgi:hypothetical protein
LTGHEGVPTPIVVVNYSHAAIYITSRLFTFSHGVLPAKAQLKMLAIAKSNKKDFMVEE